MTWRGYLLLYLLSLGLLFLVASFQDVPGYMDAEYYFAGGLRLAGGEGFTEPFLWNYLDEPAGLPHPSHIYWMPLASILAYLPMRMGNSATFAAGRIGFILLAAFIPLLSAAMAYRFNPRTDSAWLAGFLALFPAFYLAYLPTSDTFGLFMLLGGLWFMVAGRPVKTSLWPVTDFAPFLLGLISGFMHLARADGVLWLGLSLLWCLWLEGEDVASRGFARVKRLSACLVGYIIIMGPWLARNQVLFGTPLSSGGGKALWFVAYNDLYAYPGNLLTFQRWWDSGVMAISAVRLDSLSQNLVSAVVVQGEIFLAPLVLLGLWRLRSQRTVQLGMLAWALTLGIMSLVFPFAGARGGFFHSAAAVQTLFWASVPVGLQVFVEWASRRRSWQELRALRFFQIGLVLLALLLSAVIIQRRVIGDKWESPAWNESAARYIELGKAVEGAGVQHGEITMVNNPPGYYLATGGSSIAIPDGDVHTLLAAAQRYGARYMLLEPNHPAGLDPLYKAPGDRPGLRYLDSFGDAYLFEIPPDSSSNG